MNATAMRRAAWLIIPLVLSRASAADFKVNYLPPETGAMLTVNAPAHTSTPLVVTVTVDGKPGTAAVLGAGLYRMKAIIADSTRHPSLAVTERAAQPADSPETLLASPAPAGAAQ